MQREDMYIGFPPLPGKKEIVQALLNDPLEIRWRLVRDLFQIKESRDREELIEDLQPWLQQADDPLVKKRITLALQALHHPQKSSEYRLVRHKGVFKSGEPEQAADLKSFYAIPPFFPVVDFHIHPKSPDLKFFSDMRQAGITHGVILATDTDPEDVQRPEVRDRLRAAYQKAPASHRMSFDSLVRHIRASLYSPTHVTNQDVADWIADYPGTLIGFGSVNLSKGNAYVTQRLEQMQRFRFKGIKFLPHSQFFNPAENENMQMVFEFCRQTGFKILSHTGCGPGPFEIIELSQNSHPGLWEPWLKKYPDVIVIMAHFGAYSTEVPGIWLFDVLELGRKYANVYADLAAVDWLLDREMVIQEIRKTIGFDRVLFATDYPLPLSTGLSWAYMVKRIKANTFLTPREKNQVLGQNAARLLNLG